MALEFRWDPKKAAANLRKHGVSFEDAATAFGDPYSVTIPDPDHSSTEHRFTLIGVTTSGLLVVVATPSAAPLFASLALVERPGSSGGPMKTPDKVKRTSDGMRTQYDFAGGVRGKYASRYRAGTNLVLLEPDVAATFRDGEAVNRALRALMDAMPTRQRRRRGARSA